MSDDPAYVTISQLSTLTGMSKDQLRGFRKRGDLHVEHRGRSVLVPRAEADAFVRFVQQATATRPRGSYCQDIPGNRCMCRCHLMRMGKLRQVVPVARSWQPRHDQILRDLVSAGTAPEQIAPILFERTAVARSVHAVRQRIRKLGISTRDGWVSGDDLIRTLGLYRRRVQQYETQGLLTPNSYGRWRRYAFAQIEALLQSEAGLTIDPRRVKDPHWRSLAETAAIVNRRRATG